MRLGAALLLLGVACRGTRTDCVPVPPDCPADAPELGLAGGFAVDVAEVGWTYDKRCRASISEPVHVRVPDDIVGLAVSIDGGSAQTAVGLGRLDGRILLDISKDQGEGSFYWEPWYHGYATVSTWVRPMRPGDDPGPGCLTMVGVADGDLAGEAGRVVFASRRAAEGRAIDVVVGVVEGTEVDRAALAQGVARMGEVLDGAGISVRAGPIVDVPWADGPFVEQEGADLDRLRASDLGGPAGALNLLVVQDFEEGDGTLGFAAGIPGPVGVQGSAASAVMLSVDAHLDEDFEDLLPNLFGETAAHEVGHQLGLFHTTEAGGTLHDFLDDTAACAASDRDLNGDGEVSAEECENFGGRNVMFWTSADFPQDQWSDGQRYVLGRSPGVGE